MNRSKQEMMIQACVGVIRKFATLPIDKTWFGSLVGFLFGILFWIYELGGARELVNLVEQFKLCLALLCFYILVLMVFKWRMGDRWSYQHWFPKALMFFANASWYGLASSAIAYDVFMFVFFRR
jgi:hypothetical protein